MAAPDTFLEDFDDPEFETLKALANLEAPSVAVCKILWMSIRTFSTSILATSSDGSDLEVELSSGAEEVELSPEVILDLSHFSSFLYLRAIKMASNQWLNDITIGFVESNSFPLEMARSVISKFSILKSLEGVELATLFVKSGDCRVSIGGIKGITAFDNCRHKGHKNSCFSALKFCGFLNRLRFRSEFWMSSK